MRVYVHPFDVFRQTFQDLWAHKLRSLLTMFGITWGVMSLLLLGAVGEGFREGQRREMAQFGENMIFLWGARISSAGGGGPTERWLMFTRDDCRLILERAPLVRSCSPTQPNWGGNIRAESALNNAALPVIGVLPNFHDIRFTPLAEGRFINEGDIAEGRRVVVIGDFVRQQLFGMGRAVGNQIRLNQVPFEVVGRLASIGREARRGTNGQMFIPLETMARYFPHPRAGTIPGAVSQLIMQPLNPDVHKQAMEQYHEVLARRYGFNPKDRDAFDEWDTMEGARRVNTIFRAMDFFLGSVGIVTLALGAMGVMNIMLVAVSERTHEIGIRKALGATYRDILLQFLMEGVTMTALSGGAGLLIGWGISKALERIEMPEGFLPPTVTWSLGLLAFAVLGVVALAAALVPARRAALLAPADAIRFEV